MKILKYKKSVLLLAVLLIFNSSCFKDLDTVPLDENQITAATAFDNPEAYKQVLAKCYAGLSVTGQEGPSGQADIEGIDEGFGQYLRALWYHQEFPTDEAVVGWNDQTIKDFHELDWDANDNFIFAFYSRVYYQISICNEFLRETTEEKLNEREVDSDLKGQIQTFRAEARFLRALSYWHALDHFRNVPFVTEEDIVGSFFPEQIQAEDLYNWIESELIDIESSLMAPRTNDYGRADQAAAWMLLSKLYMNAEVYANKNAYSDAITYTQRVIDSGYNLDAEYQDLFLADNYQSEEIIFPVIFDGVNTRTWGGMTFILRAGIGGNMIANDFGVESGWGGTRSTSALPNKFSVLAGSGGGGIIVAPQTGETYPEIFVAGSYVSWQFTDAFKLSSILSDEVYEGFVYFPEDNAKLKFTTAANFTINYGDDNADGSLEEGGDNITVPNAGGYKLTVNLNDFSYTLEPANWGLIGSATAGGWDMDEDMTFDAVENAWVIQANLQPGVIKFRANDDWVINFGDDGGDAFLEQEGADILIQNPGSYSIKLFVDKPDYTYSIETSTVDKRGLFHVDGQTRVIGNISKFEEGYPPTKFKNINRDGSRGSNVTWVDIDFPMFRLADAYLMYAEAVLRGGSGGDAATALDYVNRVRVRAYGETAGEIPASDLDLQFLLDERARELHWECHRRTDLVRYGLLTTGDYMWDWKGGDAAGASVDNKYNYFPIPAADIGANPNLKQNDGY